MKSAKGAKSENIANLANIANISPKKSSHFAKMRFKMARFRKRFHFSQMRFHFSQMRFHFSQMRFNFARFHFTRFHFARFNTTQIKERFFYALFALSAGISIVAVVAICAFLFSNAIPMLGKIGVIEFIFGFDWYPNEAIFGIFAMIIGSLYISALAIAIATPMGIFSAR